MENTVSKFEKIQKKKEKDQPDSHVEFVMTDSMDENSLTRVTKNSTSNIYPSKYVVKCHLST